MKERANDEASCRDQWSLPMGAHGMGPFDLRVEERWSTAQQTNRCCIEMRTDGPCLHGHPNSVHADTTSIPCAPYHCSSTQGGWVSEHHHTASTQRRVQLRRNTSEGCLHEHTSTAHADSTQGSIPRTQQRYGWTGAYLQVIHRNEHHSAAQTIRASDLDEVQLC